MLSRVSHNIFVSILSGVCGLGFQGSFSTDIITGSYINYIYLKKNQFQIYSAGKLRKIMKLFVSLVHSIP